MSMAQQAAMAATGGPDHLDRVVHSVTDATKRLSQISTSTTNTATQSSKRRSRDTIGPWKLGKTLGKGSSGRVRLAKNMETGKLAAVKIVPKTKSSRPNALPYGIEREIIIMKLISHPNVMGLYEVWENKLELFLVLEYVDGGELFDYLVSRGRLSEKEAIHYFRQIIEGTAYCHSFNICHRDLKPENLLLDKKNKRIKIADFGMAALQTSNKLLETSCGSPHYASPEIVMGKTYNGGPSDVWSCGIILFALLTGHLPFNDDNIKRLLLKVQAGKYQMPQAISPEAQDLISRILVVDPEKRITINDILLHPLITKYDNKRSKSNSDLHILSHTMPQICKIRNERDVDPTILQNLQILWHGASKDFIMKRLLEPELTEEKTFYSLLLAYQQRQLKSGPKPPPVNAPKILQKSQFSVPSIKSQSSPHKEHVASSSRVFKSNSKKRISASASKRSLHNSSSKRSLGSLKHSASKKYIESTAKNPQEPPLPSKRSLYSLNSISKRSVNLKDYVSDEPQPPLPQQSEFELLCEEILFGAGLVGITEEAGESSAEAAGRIEPASDTETEKIAITLESANTAETDDMADSSAEREGLPSILIGASAGAEKSSTTVNIPVSKAPRSHQAGLGDMAHKANVETPTEPSQIDKTSTLKSERTALQVSKLKSTSSSRNLRVASAPSGKDDVPVSLDPRRNVSQPNSIELLLNKYNLRAHLKSKSNLKKLRNSGDWGRSAFETSCAPTSSGFSLGADYSKDFEGISGADLTNALAQSSSINGDDSTDTGKRQSMLRQGETKPNTYLPSANLNSSATFKNLSQYLSDGNSSTTRASSVVRRPIEGSFKSFSQGVSRKPSTNLPKNNLAVQRPRKISQVSANDTRSEMPSDMSFALDIPTQTFTAQAVQISNGSSQDQLEQVKKPILLQEEKGEDDINIFEDAPCDNVSIATSSSGLDSQPHVHRKATSIDTLNTTSVLNPSADVRVSLYANNMTSSAKLPRETTEEIISKFKLSPEKGSVPPQKRFSYQKARGSISQSIISMFKDLDDDIEDHASGSAAESHFNGGINATEMQQDAPSNVEEQIPEKEPVAQKRVTMLFDDESSTVFKSSPIKNPAPKPREPTAVQPRPSSTTVPFTKSKLDTVVENDQAPLPQKIQKPLRPAPPPPAKKTWFSKFIRSLTPNVGSKEALAVDHNTRLEFENVHILMLKEFKEHSIDYELKRLDKRGSRSHADYNCKFVQGQFRFKIRIEGTGNSTMVHIKKKGKQDKTAFERFNDNVSSILKAEESKKHHQ
ncbi:LAQU0S01e11188g1_1 [Lachancea quebecensis]|uniref:non-specific serine/threonine protein kinase n=1 Tax=Lachancea quebecensis TaxID=1654605 RepID=A0A0P1KLR2_9SACH|nr:LAQU0S01e11188g1_1 [Lachancea quebecensis]